MADSVMLSKFGVLAANNLFILTADLNREISETLGGNHFMMTVEQCYKQLGAITRILSGGCAQMSG